MTNMSESYLEVKYQHSEACGHPKNGCSGAPIDRQSLLGWPQTSVSAPVHQCTSAAILLCLKVRLAPVQPSCSA